MSQPKIKSTKIILIAGPTASGKSAHALEIARSQPSIIINADALQIYEGLPLLTAQPHKSDQSLIPHALYGEVPASEPSSVGLWVKKAKRAVKDAEARELTPILVGGTGLYFKAFIEGLSSIPDIPSEVRSDVQKLYEEWGEIKFRAALSKMDGSSAEKIAKNDQQRLTRAYEVVHHTGKTLAEWQKHSVPHDISLHLYEAHLHAPPRDELYQACDQRFLRMLEQGAVDEVASLMKRNLKPDLPIMKTIGVREIAAYLNKEMSLEDALRHAQQMTRNYAKRQMTWFRNQWPFPHDP